MAYVRQWGKTAHYIKPYAKTTICHQLLDGWETKPYFSRELKDGEELCESCANCLRAERYGDDTFTRKHYPRYVKRVPTYSEVRDLLRSKPSP